MAVNRTILILEGLPMAHMKAYVPNFPKHMRERSQSLKLWVLDLSDCLLYTSDAADEL